MALSNWDTLAVNLNGETQAGFFVSPGGVRVEIYKNWVYVHDPKAWREGQFAKDTIMEIHYGNIRYHDMEIRAIRGPQEGVYVVCWHENYENKQTEYTGMIGCGVSGYNGEDWVGVTSDSVEFLQKWIGKNERMWTDEEVSQMMRDLLNPKIDPQDWKRELREEYTFDFPEEIARVKLDKAIRYNQGDMYFAEKVGLPLGATKPGESDEPAIMKMIKPS